MPQRVLLVPHVDVKLHVDDFFIYPAALGVKLARAFVCSSVDMLPFIYTLALGNESWRCNPGDIVNYLDGRESINDAFNTDPN